MQVTEVDTGNKIGPKVGRVSPNGKQGKYILKYEYVYTNSSKESPTEDGMNDTKAFQVTHLEEQPTSIKDRIIVEKKTPEPTIRERKLLLQSRVQKISASLSPAKHEISNDEQKQSKYKEDIKHHYNKRQLPASVYKKSFKIMCHDYVRSVCAKGPYCRFTHELILEQLRYVFVFCHAFMNHHECNHPRCKYVHANKYEQRYFYRTGHLPVHTIAHIKPIPKTMPPPKSLAATVPPALPKTVPVPKTLPAWVFELPNQRPPPLLQLPSMTQPPPPATVPQTSQSMVQQSLQPTMLATQSLLSQPPPSFTTPPPTSMAQPLSLWTTYPPPPISTAQLPPQLMTHQPPPLLPKEHHFRRNVTNVENFCHHYTNADNSGGAKSLRWREHSRYAASAASTPNTTVGSTVSPFKRKWSAAINSTSLDAKDSVTNSDESTFKQQKCDNCDLSLTMLNSLDGHMRVLKETFTTRMTEFTADARWSHEQSEQASNAVSTHVTATNTHAVVASTCADTATTSSVNTSRTRYKFKPAE